MAGSPGINQDSSVRFIGCCGAYCKTCRALRENACKGCKLGYNQEGRDISRAKCAIKVCCFKNLQKTCGDCPKYTTCDIIGNFHSKKGFKYKKYKQSMEFIRDNGYTAFMKRADTWNGPYGKLEQKF